MLVEGKLGGGNVSTQTKTATPYTTAQDIEPDEGYYLNKVTVNAITYTVTDNTAGGKTMTIGTVAPSI